MAEIKKIVNFPGLAKSVVWNFFGFYEVERKLMKEKAVCKLCFKEYTYKGLLYFSVFCVYTCQIVKTVLCKNINLQ